MTRLWTAALILLTAAVPARADYMDWTYTTSSSPPGGVSVNPTSSAGGANVQLTGYGKAQAGGGQVSVLQTQTATGVTTPITFDPKTAVYTMSLTITDTNTKDSGTLNFNGSIGGNLSATSSGLTTTLTPASSGSLSLDGHLYTVSIPTAALPAPNAPGGAGYIYANIQVSDLTNNGGGGGNPGGNVKGVPEPASLLLGGLGLALCGAARRRLR